MILLTIIIVLPQIAGSFHTEMTMLVVGAMIAIVAMLAYLALAFGSQGVHDRKQALALPEGSVRALFTLLLLVLFAVITLHFFEALGKAARDEPRVDFAKQVVSLVGTLLTSAASFYFASRTSAEATNDEPAIFGSSSGGASRGQSTTVTLAGRHLGNVTAVSLARGQETIAGTNITAAENRVVADFAIPAGAMPGDWDVVADTSDKRTIRFASALRVT
ncbi:MAG TPA: hypothetical protein VFN10_02780 [Thermoanaerobaculia bacterium]|nr:hypothetical protein [Thermoanaerobaculia bacterium]